MLIQSIFVYGFIILVMSIYGSYAHKQSINMNKNCEYSFLLKEYFIVPVLVFCFFAVVRYNVGVDCENYKDFFYDILFFGSTYRDDLEKGFYCLLYFLSQITSSHYLFFFIFAFVQIVSYYFVLKKFTIGLEFLGFALFSTGIYWSLMNGMRQNFVACCFMMLISLILEKKWQWYALAIILLCSIHKTAALLFPIGFIAYFLQYKVLPRYIQLVLLALCFLLMNSFNLDVLNDWFHFFGNQVGFDNERVEDYLELEQTKKRFGFRMFLLYGVYSIIAYNSEKIISYFNNLYLNVYYNLFFIGCCWTLLFYNDFLMERISYFFLIFSPVIVSIAMGYFYQKKDLTNKILFVIIYLLSSMYILYTLYADSIVKGVEYTLFKFDFK